MSRRSFASHAPRPILLLLVAACSIAGCNSPGLSNDPVPLPSGASSDRPKAPDPGFLARKPEEKAEVLERLRSRLESPGEREQAWRDLAAAPDPLAEPMLVQTLCSLASDPPAGLLDALVACGNHLAREQFAELASRASSTPWPARERLWRALFRMDRPFAVASLAGDVPRRGNPSAQIDAPSAQLLAELVTKLADNRAELASVLPELLELRYFDMSSGAEPPGQQLFAAIKGALKRHPTPAFEATLLLFLDLGNPELAKLADEASYKELAARPWLVPDHYFFPPPGGARALAKLQGLHLELPGQPALGFDNLGMILGPPRARQAALEQLEEDLLPPIVNRVYSQLAARDHAGNPLLVDMAAVRQQRKTLRSNYIFGPPSVYEVRSLALSAVSPLFSDLEKSSPQRYDADDAIVDASLREQALLLYAILHAWRHLGGVSGPIPFAGLDDELERRLADPRAAKFVKSTVAVAPLVRTGEDEPDPNIQQGCTHPSVKLLARQIRFENATYRETLELTCPAGTTRLGWIGSIPLPLLVPLRHHVRLLDPIGISLAVRELDAARHGPRSSVGNDELDLILGLGVEAIPYVAAALGKPETPLADLHDTLRAIVPVRDRASEMNSPSRTDHFIRNNVATSADDYARFRSDAVNGLNDYFETVETASVLNRIKQAVLKMPDSIYSCQPFCYSPPNGGCGTTCTNRPNRTREAMLRQVDSAMASYNARPIKILGNWEFTRQHCGNGVIDYRGGLFDPTLTRFLTYYDYNSEKPYLCTIFSEGELRYPQPVLDALRSALATDHSFLDRYDLDLLGVREGNFARLLAALEMNQHRAERVATVRRVLREMGLTHLGSGYKGTPPWDSWISGGRHLTATADGVAVLTELAAVNALARYAAGSLPPVGKQSAAFLDAAFAGFASAQAEANRQANAIVHDVEQKVAQADPSGWSFGVTFGLPAPFIALSFSIGNIGVSLSLNAGGGAVLSGTWSGIPIPGALSYVPARTDLPTGGSSVRQQEMSALEADVGRGIAGMISHSGTIGIIHAQLGTSPSAVVQATPAPLWTKPSGTITADTTLDRQNLAGAISRAVEKLTEVERARVFEALKQPVFPADLDALVRDRAKEAIEEEKIARREWMHTTVVDELIPVARQGRRFCPISGCVDFQNAAQVDDYIRDFNQASEKNFLDSIVSARRQGRLKMDPVPAVTLTYGNDFQIMVFRFDYTVLGEQIHRYEMFRTYFGLVPLVRQDPSGHVLEKLSIAASQEIMQTSGLLERIDAAELHEAKAYWDRVKGPSQAAAENLTRELKQGIEEFLKGWLDWNRSEGAKEQPDKPFVPRPLGTPLLNFFAPPAEWIRRANEKMSEILLYQEEGPFGRKASSGQVILDQPRLP